MKTVISTVVFLALSSVTAAEVGDCEFWHSAAARSGEVVGSAGVGSGQTARLAIRSASMDPVTATILFLSADGCLVKKERVVIGSGRVAIADISGHELFVATGRIRSQMVGFVAFEPAPDGTAVDAASFFPSLELFHSTTGDTDLVVNPGRPAPPLRAAMGEGLAPLSKTSSAPLFASTCSAEVSTTESKLRQYYESMLRTLDARAKAQEKELHSKIQDLEAKNKQLQDAKAKGGDQNDKPAGAAKDPKPQPPVTGPGSKRPSK